MRITKDMWMSMNHLGVETFYNFFDINISFFLPILECNNTCKSISPNSSIICQSSSLSMASNNSNVSSKDTVLMSREFVLYPTDTFFIINE